MQQDEFEALVARLQKAAADNPGRYKRRVFGLAIMGYAYILFVLLALFGLIGGLVAVAVFAKGPGLLAVKKLLIPLVMLVIVVLRAMWVRLSAPEGLVLNRKDFPLLFECLQKLRKQFKGPRIHTVLLTEDFNAAISQVPRLGIFGWQKNYLIIGLPLMEALSAEQFMAVIGHEYGHLSGAHGKFSSWIYRIRQTWYKLMQTLEEKGHRGAFIFSRFFSWYAPYFNAYSFVLARANEYEADRVAAEFTSPKQAADALIGVHVKSEYLDRDFWPRLYKRADQEPQPNVSPYVDMAPLLHRHLPDATGEALLQAALEMETGCADTHPCLRERLASLQQEAQLPQPCATSSASHFLGEHLPRIKEQFSGVWREQISENWQQRYEYAKKAMAQKQTLLDRGDALSAQEAYELAALEEEFVVDADSESLYRRALAKDPNHTAANYALGRVLLAQADDSGIVHIERAMDGDGAYITEGCRLVYNYLVDRDRREEAERYEKRFYERIEIEEKAQAERNHIGLKDVFLPHAATPQMIGSLVSQLRRYKRIAAAYLVRKQTTLSDQPLYLLGITHRWWWCHGPDNDAAFTRKLADEFEIEEEMFFVVLANDARKLKKRVKAMEDAIIYRRQDKFGEVS